MKIFNTNQIRNIDEYSIKNEPINSIDLMERAAQAIFTQFKKQFSTQHSVYVIAGNGNNGGDALALARLLLLANYRVKVFFLTGNTISADCKTNYQRLIMLFPDALTLINDIFLEPQISANSILIDGIFGSGLSRPLQGIYAQVVNWINHSGCIIVAIDIPTGLSSEENKLVKPLVIVKATFTYSLHFQKLAFMFPEISDYCGKISVLDIGLHPEIIKQTETDYHILEKPEISEILKTRTKFSHKGTFGHTLIVAGKKGMAGAALLSAKAALRSGTGLVTVHSASKNRTILQSSAPEIIFISDSETDYVSKVDSIDSYNSMAIGPGIGTHPKTAEMLKNTFLHTNIPYVVDADALNIIASNNELLELIPKNSIITPHPKEFERLFGLSNNSYERLLKAQNVAIKYQIIIVLKGAHTLIATPEGKLFFNSTGNSGMATAGMGDVLTGIIAGLLAQGYNAENAAKIAVFLHGTAADIAIETESEESLISSDLITCIGKAFKSIRQ